MRCSVVGRQLTREVVKQNSSLILFQIFDFKMCHPNNFNKQIEVKKARKVVKKYRKMSYRKEMMRLRNLLSADENVSEGEILDKTVSLIEELESRLMAGSSEKIQLGGFLAAFQKTREMIKAEEEKMES